MKKWFYLLCIVLIGFFGSTFLIQNITPHIQKNIDESNQKESNSEGDMLGEDHYIPRDDTPEISGKPDGDITFPNHGSIILGPQNDILIGDGINPFQYILQKPYIQNNSAFPLKFDSLCVVKKSLDYSLVGSSPQCQSIGTLKPGQRFTFHTYPNFISNKEAVFGSYADNELLITVQDNGTLYENAYFVNTLKVRVSQPMITTHSGNVSNVETKNREIDTIDNTDELGETKSNNPVITSLLDEFSHSHGIENVFTLKNKNFRIVSNIFDSLQGPRTYIIEDGDLLIDSDIIYSSHITFVVKGGNIKVKDTVKHLDGTYITLSQGKVGGKIMSNQETDNILKVNGTLYGNTHNLFRSRIFIQEDPNAHIGIGMVVSFGSTLFKKPAPLTGYFISEYLQREKIAK